MAKGGTIACQLPATSFYLGATFAPARQMVEAGVPVAVASDFNPGSTPNLSLQLAGDGAALCHGLDAFLRTNDEMFGRNCTDLAGKLRAADGVDLVGMNFCTQTQLLCLPNTATCSVKPVSLHRRNPAAS